MAKKRSRGGGAASGRQVRHGDQIKIGDISGGTGVAIGRGAQAVVTQTHGVTVDEIAKAFGALQHKVNALPEGPEKSVAQNAITALEAEARKGEQAAESSVQKWMNFLAETAPDAWEVAVDMFTNPIRGMGTVFKKIAEKAKAEREAQTTDVAKK